MNISVSLSVSLAARYPCGRQEIQEIMLRPTIATRSRRITRVSNVCSYIPIINIISSIVALCLLANISNQLEKPINKALKFFDLSKKAFSQIDQNDPQFLAALRDNPQLRSLLDEYNTDRFSGQIEYLKGQKKVISLAMAPLYVSQVLRLFLSIFILIADTALKAKANEDAEKRRNRLN
jgi:hypothetical protein